MEQNNNEVKVDLQIAYKVAIDTIAEKETRIIELKALVNQLATQLHEMQHKYGEEH